MLRGEQMIGHHELPTGLHAVAAIMLAAVVSCGSQSGGRSADDQAARPHVSAAEDQCQSLVDDKVYTDVLAAKSVSGEQLKAWFRTRSNGIYSPSQVDAVDDHRDVVVCELTAPGLSVSSPAPLESSRADDDVEPGAQTALVLLGYRKTGPELDAVGSQTSLSELFSKLG